MISLKSADAMLPEALASIEAEITKLVDKFGVWSWSSLRELRDVAQEDPTATFVRLCILLGLKHAETELSSKRGASPSATA